MAKKDREKKRQRDSSDGPEMHRRGLFTTAAKLAGLEAVREITQGTDTVVGIANRGAHRVLDAIIEHEEPVPADLQRNTTLTRTGRNKVYGYGHSIMAGVRADDVPIVARVGTDLRQEGLRVDTISEAVPGSTVNELGSQLDNAIKHGRIPPKEEGEKRDVQLWTGGNEVPPSTVAALNSLRQNPLQPGKWRQLREETQQLNQNYRDQFTTHGTRIVRETEADSLTAYGFPDLTRAQRIGQTDVKTGESSTLIVDDNSLSAKAVKAAAKMAMNSLNRTMYQATRKVRDVTGIEATGINPNSVITPSSFENPEGIHDQHINARTAGDVARLRVRRYNIEE
ncbi:MAG TPA: hypothetical protein VEW42_01120 [Candidatus Eisenbacteria bacterium]|nr:hypothetical protein [Candidatus Eisenbacteria bacterium]